MLTDLANLACQYPAHLVLIAFTGALLRAGLESSRWHGRSASSLYLSRRS